MKHLFSAMMALPAAAQDLTNAGATIAVQPGATLCVGLGGLSNQTGRTLANSAAVRVDGSLTNAGTPDLGADALEVSNDLTEANPLTRTNGRQAQHPERKALGAAPASRSHPDEEALGRCMQGSLEIMRNTVSGAAVDFGHGAVLDPTPTPWARW